MEKLNKDMVADVAHVIQSKWIKRRVEIGLFFKYKGTYYCVVDKHVERDYWLVDIGYPDPVYMHEKAIQIIYHAYSVGR